MQCQLNVLKDVASTGLVYLGQRELSLGNWVCQLGHFVFDYLFDQFSIDTPGNHSMN